ncbi:MAG: hypothetical protein INH41_26230 [Myxococcaceae bacterium]|nr:hypothetical protein [Myxococcaceae bacterium]MCA3015900.1 hypothetical protein [Myxococcaceae bacterium]
MKHLLAVLSVLAITACGGGVGAANVAACNSLVSKLKCGTAAAPLSTSTCDGYANTTCDFSAYFRCIEGAYVCTNNMYDTSKLAMAGSCTVPTCR